jgi:16S rRNA (cytosine967-C5)-methyltransferase
MIAVARQAAYDALRLVATGRADLPAALARVRGRLADERDRALAAEIATGTLRWQAAFDRVVAAFAGRPLARLDPEVLDILRMTAFQLLHLDRVPASAAVNDAVQLTRAAGKASAAGLVNAILRRVSRERQRLPLPPRPAGGDRAAELAYLSVTLSHPEWLAARWLDRHGFADAEAWARFDNEPARLTLRANRLAIDRDALTARLAAHGVDVEPARFARDGLVVRSGNPLLTPLADGRLFVVQDEASQLVAAFTAAAPGERIFDACAAPGGKTTAMAGDMRNQGLVVASDIRGRRLDLLAKTVASAGATAAAIVRADATAPLPFRAGFDRVLLDAPCSGLGTLRRDPDIRWRRSPDDLPRRAAIQASMLDRCAAVVRPGGRLVYATCSSEPEENEAVVDAFLERHPEFRAARGDEIPAGFERFLTPALHFRTFPFRDGLEAFYAAALVRSRPT